MLDKRENYNLLLDSVVTKDRIIDTDTGKVEVLLVVGLDKAVGDVRNVHAGVRLSSDVRLPVVGVEGINKVLVEAAELLGKFNLVGDIGYALGVADANWLLNPKHVGDVVPRVRVGSRGKSALLPRERAIFIEQPDERTAARATIEPVSIVRRISCMVDTWRFAYQMTISSGVWPVLAGKNQKNSFRVSLGSFDMGSKPA